jgi:hypothetical protein
MVNDSNDQRMCIQVPHATENNQSHLKNYRGGTRANIVVKMVFPGIVDEVWPVQWNGMSQDF